MVPDECLLLRTMDTSSTTTSSSTIAATDSSTTSTTGPKQQQQQALLDDEDAPSASPDINTSSTSSAGVEGKTTPGAVENGSAEDKEGEEEEDNKMVIVEEEKQEDGGVKEDSPSIADDKSNPTMLDESSAGKEYCNGNDSGGGGNGAVTLKPGGGIVLRIPQHRLEINNTSTTSEESGSTIVNNNGSTVTNVVNQNGTAVGSGSKDASCDDDREVISNSSDAGANGDSDLTTSTPPIAPPSMPPVSSDVTASVEPATAVVAATDLSVSGQNDASSTPPSRRSSYIDVVGLSEDTEVSGVLAASNGATDIATEDSEDEDKLVIHEGDSKSKGEDDEVLPLCTTTSNAGAAKRSASEESEDGSAKKRTKYSGAASTQPTDLTVPSTHIINLSNKAGAAGGKESVLLPSAAGAQPPPAAPPPAAAAAGGPNREQTDEAFLQIDREIQALKDEVRKKEEEWNCLIRLLKQKEELALRLKRRSQVMQYQDGASLELPSQSVIDLTSSSTQQPSFKEDPNKRPPIGGGLLAALTAGQPQPSSYDTTSPLAMMTKLLSAQGTGISATPTDSSSNRPSNSSPNVSIIDIHTRTSSPTSITSGGPSLSDALKSKLTRHLLGAAVAASTASSLTKPILPKPSVSVAPLHSTSSTNGANLLSSLATQTPAPQTLAGMLTAAAAHNGPITSRDGGLSMLGGGVSVAGGGGGAQGANLAPTGYGPQGPTISVQQIIAAHRKDNPSSPPVRGAKRGAWRQKYDSKRGGGRGADSSAAAQAAAGGGINLSDPTLSYNDMLLQFAQLTQQQAAAAAAHAQQNDKNNSGSPQISIIPVSHSDGGASYSSAITSLAGGLSVTPAPPPHTSSSSISKSHAPSPMMEQSSALAKLLMESRAGSGSNKPNSLLEQQQQSANNAAAANSRCLTLSALLSGGTATNVREKAAAAAAASAIVAAQQNAAKKGEGLTEGASNPKCQGCHKVRAQFVCAGCGNQWYCSRECQVAAWDEHSERCNT